MWECLSLAWARLGSNSGQVQILIAIIALIYARKAYRKVLHQIKISDEQTYLTIQQMTKYNEERVFELRLRLKLRLGEHLIRLRDIATAYENLENKMRHLILYAQEKNTEELESVYKFERENNTKIMKGNFFVSEYRKKIDYAVESIFDTNKIALMEKVFEEIEQYQILYDEKWKEINSINSTIDFIVMGLDTKDSKRAFALMLGLEK